MHPLLAPVRTVVRHRGFMVLLACNILVGLAFAFVSPFFSMYGTIEVGMPPVVFGVFMTVTSVSGIAISTMLARWSDTRLSRRTVLLLGGIAGTLGYVVYAFVRDVAWLTLNGCVLMGIASITFSQLFAHARDLLARSDTAPKDAPLYMNVFRLFFALSWTVGPAVAAFVMQRYSYRGTFLVAGLCFLLFVLAVLRFVPAVPPSSQARAAAEQVPLRRVLMRRDVLAHFLAFAVLYVAGTMAVMNLPLLVLQTLGGTSSHVGIIYSVAPVFEIPFMFFFGLLATKGDQARLIRIAAILAIAYYGLLAVVRTPQQIYPVQILSAAITAVIGGVAITFFQNFIPDQPGTATNLYSTATRIGSTTGYLLFGVLAAAFGHRAVFTACAGLSVLAALFLFCAASRRKVVLAAGIVKDAPRSSAPPHENPDRR